MSYEKDRNKKPDHTSGSSAAGLAPGKSTLASKLPAKADPAVEAAAPVVLWSMDDVLRGHARTIDDAPAHYRKPLGNLLTLHNYTSTPNGVALWDAMMKDLGPVMQYHSDDTERDQNVHRKMDELHASVTAAGASQRVDSAIVDRGPDGKKKVIEMPDDNHPREQAEVMKSQLPKLIATMNTLIERAHTAGDLARMERDLGGHAKGVVQRLETMAGVLTLAQGWLKLTDEEFAKELGEIRGVMDGVTKFSELVKIVVEMSGATVGLCYDVAGILAKRAGKEALVETLAETGEKISAKFGSVVAAIEIIHGAAVMLDSNATPEARIDGAAEMGMGTGALITGVTAGSSIGALVVAGPYYMAKTAASLYSGAALGLETGYLNELFGSMQDHGAHISHAVDHLVAAEQLHLNETDPARKQALAVEQTRRGALLGSIVDTFLDRCKPTGADHGVGNEFTSHYPGNYQIVAEAFAPTLALRGAKSGEAAAKAAAAVLGKMAWCYQHAESIAIGSMKHMSLEQMEKAEAEDEKKKATKEAKEKKEAAEKKKAEDEGLVGSDSPMPMII